VGIGRKAKTSKGRSLSEMAHLKKSTVEVKTKENCLANELVVAIAKVRKNPDYKVYMQSREILPKVSELMQDAGVDLSRGGGIPELQAFQFYLSELRILVYSGLKCDSIMFDGQVATPQRISLLYYNQHYHVIRTWRQPWPNDTFAQRVIRVAEEAHSTGAMRRDTPARPTLLAFRTTPGSPATIATATSVTPRASRITGVSRNLTRLCKA
jgi:hypothetical protein